MQNSTQIRTHLINSCMEGQLGRGLVRANAGAVGFHADDIAAIQGALVHACGGDPNVAVVVNNRKVAAGGGGHALVVNTLHKHNQLIRGMNVINVHNIPPLIHMRYINAFSLCTV